MLRSLPPEIFHEIPPENPHMKLFQTRFCNHEVLIMSSIHIGVHLDFMCRKMHMSPLE